MNLNDLSLISIDFDNLLTHVDHVDKVELIWIGSFNVHTVWYLLIYVHWSQLIRSNYMYLGHLCCGYLSIFIVLADVSLCWLMWLLVMVLIYIYIFQLIWNVWDRFSLFENCQCVVFHGLSLLLDSHSI